MSKQRPPAAPERNVRRGGLDQELVAAINKQVRSAEESLRDYVDKRVGAAGAGNRGARSGSGDAASAHSLGGRMRHFLPWVQPVAAAVIALGLIAAFVYLVMLGRARDARLAALENRIATLEERHAATSSHGQPAAVSVQQAEPQHHPLTPATELPGDGWAVRFQGLNERDPKRLAAITNAIVTGNQESAMPPNIAGQFAKMREELSTGTKLGKTDRALLRTLLLQCIADQTAESGDPLVNMDGRFAGTPKVLLKRVKTHFNVVSKPGNEEQTADFESEVILRWAKERGL